MLDTILLIDDDETTNYLNERLLKRLQIARKIHVSCNGEEAISYLKQNCTSPTYENTDNPELIFLDIKMPVMDGFEFLDEYHKIRPLLRCQSIITMLTSSASQTDLNRLQKYGSIRKYLTKPLTELQITNLLEEFFPESSHS